MDNSEDEARVIINSDDMNISCSCKKFISLGTCILSIARETVFNFFKLLIYYKQCRYIMQAHPTSIQPK
jgi:hypothetical protein